MAIKISLITIHWANNYGASLQVFATVKALSEHGEVSVIDYRNTYAAKGMTWLRFGTRLRDILRLGKDLFRLLPRYRVIKKFETFSHTHLNLTPMVTSDADLEQLAKEFDVFVSGSDQIWNPKIISEDGQLDPHYFLDFVAEKTKFSYASSLGTYQYNNIETTKVRDLLKDYRGITVREKDSAEYLSTLLQRKVDNVLDPTLLFTKAQWLAFFNITPEKTDQPYILVYALKKDLLLKQTVEQVAAKLGYPVITIDQDPFTNFSNDQHIKDAGPVEFIELFANAGFIVTNSFHGTCFSVNFNIPFIVTSPLSSINRIENLLSIVGASNRITLHADNVQDIISEDINFEYANTQLESLRIACKKYIKDTIET